MIKAGKLQLPTATIVSSTVFLFRTFIRIFSLTFRVIKMIEAVAIDVQHQAVLAITYAGHGSGFGGINFFDKVFDCAKI